MELILSLFTTFYKRFSSNCEVCPTFDARAIVLSQYGFITGDLSLDDVLERALQKSIVPHRGVEDEALRCDQGIWIQWSLRLFS